MGTKKHSQKPQLVEYDLVTGEPIHLKGLPPEQAALLEEALKPTPETDEQRLAREMDGLVIVGNIPALLTAILRELVRARLERQGVING